MKIFLLFSIFTFSAFSAGLPKNAHIVPQAWGWECDHGYVQSRISCVKVRIPKNAKLTEDGHGWECEEGYEKYRDECNKEKK